MDQGCLSPCPRVIRSRRNMQFGVCLPHRWKYASARLIADVAQEAESLRFDSVWVTDHVIVPVHHVERGHIFYEALMTLAFVTSITRTVAMGMTSHFPVSSTRRSPIRSTRRVAGFARLRFSGRGLVIGSDYRCAVIARDDARDRFGAIVSGTSRPPVPADLPRRRQRVRTQIGALTSLPPKTNRSRRVSRRAQSTPQEARSGRRQHRGLTRSAHQASFDDRLPWLPPFGTRGVVVLALPPFQIWLWGVAIVKLHALSQHIAEEVQVEGARSVMSNCPRPRR